MKINKKNKAVNELWSDCWCKSKSVKTGCRNCQTYQLMYGLSPTCDEYGNVAKNPFSMGRFWEITDKEFNELTELQKKNAH